MNMISKSPVLAVWTSAAVPVAAGALGARADAWVVTWHLNRKQGRFILLAADHLSGEVFAIDKLICQVGVDFVHFVRGVGRGMATSGGTGAGGPGGSCSLRHRGRVRLARPGAATARGYRSRSESRPAKPATPKTDAGRTRPSTGKLTRRHASLMKRLLFRCYFIGTLQSISSVDRGIEKTRRL